VFGQPFQRGAGPGGNPGGSTGPGANQPFRPAGR
jgi:hypothetical protein